MFSDYTNAIVTGAGRILMDTNAQTATIRQPPSPCVRKREGLISTFSVEEAGNRWSVVSSVPRCDCGDASRADRECNSAQEGGTGGAAPDRRRAHVDRRRG